MVILSAIVTTVLLPPGILIVALLAGIVLVLAGKRRAGVIVTALSILLFYALSTGVVERLLLGPLESACPALDTSEAGRSKLAGGTVVVLGGGLVERSPEEGMKASLGVESGKRMGYGLRLAAGNGLPLVFSGGNVYPEPGMETEADAAQRYAENWGRPVSCSFEGKSRTTRENARYVARDYRPARVILVTSAYHMKRAMIAFGKEGLDVVAAPTDYKQRSGLPSALDWLPDPLHFYYSCRALHEYLGIVEYSILR
jgi:uncharacterized SAM-binding protein YcdF (DUF218 family)